MILGTSGICELGIYTVRDGDLIFLILEKFPCFFYIHPNTIIIMNIILSFSFIDLLNFLSMLNWVPEMSILIHVCNTYDVLVLLLHQSGHGLMIYWYFFPSKLPWFAYPSCIYIWNSLLQYRVSPFMKESLKNSKPTWNQSNDFVLSFWYIPS